MPTFEDPVEIRRPWSDWIFLRQHRNVESNGGFHIHNPWGNSDQPQGVPARNRLEVAYRTPAGQDLWAQFVLHGPTGRIGLGTGDPQAHMDVVNPWGDWLFLRQQRDRDGGGGFHIHNPWGNSSQPQGDGSRNRLEIGYQMASGQHLWGQWVIHGPTGNVGIGTTSPDKKLHVEGSENGAHGIQVENTNNGTAAVAETRHVNNGGVEAKAGVTSSGFSGNANAAYFVGYNGSGTLAKTVLGSQSSAMVEFWVNSVAKMVIDTSGRVGIGTTNPGAELAVNGTIEVQTDVKIGDLTVPDYVFDQAYNLRSLSDVKDFIEKHKHLPDVPSASDYKKEGGVRIGKLNELLLRKVEELTLYILGQENRIKELEMKLA